MLLYEVTLLVDAGIAEEYLDWLTGHAARLLVLDGFGSAAVYEDEPEGERRRFVAHYYVRTAGSLETYLRDHASLLRAEGEERFGSRVSATRRVLRLHRELGG